MEIFVVCVYTTVDSGLGARVPKTVPLNASLWELSVGLPGQLKSRLARFWFAQGLLAERVHVVCGIDSLPSSVLDHIDLSSFIKT